jgi:hypothetical protein
MKGRDESGYWDKTFCYTGIIEMKYLSLVNRVCNFLCFLIWLPWFFISLPWQLKRAYSIVNNAFDLQGNKEDRQDLMDFQHHDYSDFSMLVSNHKPISKN